MRIAFVFLCLATLNACATPAPAPTASAAKAAGASAPATQATSTGDPDRVICKAHAETGTRLGATKTCMTARKWKEQEEYNRNNTAGYQSNTPAPGSAAPMRP